MTLNFEENVNVIVFDLIHSAEGDALWNKGMNEWLQIPNFCINNLLEKD